MKTAIKRLLSVLLAAMLLLSAVAFAEDIPLAAGIVDTTSLERYASWTKNENTWSVYSNETAAALALLGNDMANNGYFYLELTGDSATGLIIPQLVFIHTAYTSIDTEVVCMLIDGVRYDFKVVSEDGTINRQKAQFMRTPLDMEGIEALRKLETAEDVRVRYLGTTAFTYTVKPEAQYPTTKQTVEAASADGVKAMLKELDALNIDSYQLWDLNEEYWYFTKGYEPEMNMTELTGVKDEDEIKLTGDWEMLNVGDSGATVTAFQKLLVANGFMLGKPDGSYGEGTLRAVRAARRFYGLMENGMCDRTLIDCLTNNEAIDNGASAADETELASIGIAQVGIKRYWFANSFATSKNVTRSAANSDNSLIIIEGDVANVSAEELSFYWQLSASVKYGDVSYEATVVCEADDGKRFDTALMPLGSGKMIIYAEIPASIAQSGDWTLVLTSDNETLEYKLG